MIGQVWGWAGVQLLGRGTPVQEPPAAEPHVPASRALADSQAACHAAEAERISSQDAGHYGKGWHADEVAVVERLAEETARTSPWDAAVKIFGDERALREAAS